MREWPSVYVVVLNWRNYPRTSGCLRSLRDATYRNLHVVVVDNHSGDGSLERLEAEFPECIFVRNAENLGFSRGCNAGIRDAIQRDAAYVLLLNNDMEVTPGLLEPAVAAAEADAQIGAVTGKVLYLDRTDLIWHAGGYIHPIRIQGFARGFKEIDRGQYNEPCDTGWASGAMSLICRGVFDKIGLLPEEYFFGQEEWDFSTAMLRAGYRIRYIPEFRAYHEADGSYRAGHPVLNIYNGYRNKMTFAKKYMSPVAWQIWRVMFWLYLQLWWPRLAREYCHTERDYRVRLAAGRMAFSDFRSGQPVELTHLVRAAERLGPTPTWGDSWRPREREKGSA